MTPDGIYFDMSFEDYLAEPRLSSGGISDLMEGPAAFWARSWLNPNREDKDTAASAAGRAYHCARLEPQSFEERYVRDLTPDQFDPETLLTNGTQIGNALAELGEAKKKAGESVEDQARRLFVAMEGTDKPWRIWHMERLEWETEVKAGREALPPDTYDQIVRESEWLHMNPEIHEKISNGAPEVTILWTDPASGIPCKIRPDYLTASHVVHMKTWDVRSFGKPGNLAVIDKLKWDGHGRVGWFYLMGLEEVRIGNVTLQGAGDKSLVSAIRERDEPLATWFLYLRRGGVPDIRMRLIRYFGRPAGVDEQSIGADVSNFRGSLTGLGQKMSIETERAMILYHECAQIYGTDQPWFPRDMMDEITDADFHENWLDSRVEPR